jgi:DNA-binding SARP family transcriptional activator/tetratricopeptide (TPR) repeat protein
MIRISVLGTTRVVGADAATLPAQQAKRLALVAYLAAARPAGSHRRDTLVALLWPELDEEHARAALRQALHGLRKTLGADPFVSAGTESVSLDRARTSCDLWDLERAIAAGDHERAVSFYQGDLCAGLHVSGCAEFEQWLDRERQRVRVQVCDSAWAAADVALQRRKPADVGKFVRVALDLADFDETALRRGMCLLANAGERAAAIAAFERFSATLARELEAEPSGETKALAATLREPTPTVSFGRPTAAPRVRPRRRQIIAAGLSVIAIGVAARMAPSASANLDSRRISVSSFANETGQAALDTLARAAELATRGALVRVENVRVIARPNDLDRAGTEVQGAVRAVRDTIELIAEVIDRSTGAIVKRVTTRFAATDASRLDAFGDRVSAAVATALYPGWGSALSQPPSYVGYRLFLDGMRNIKLERHEEATVAFRRAFEEDSTFTVAGLLAAAELYQLRRFDAADSMAKRIAPRRPLLPQVDGHLFDWVTRSLDGDRIGARSAMAAVVHLAPEAEMAWLQLAVDNVETGRPLEALDALEHVSDTAGIAEGWSSVAATRAEALHLLGDHKRELGSVRQAMRRHPELGVLASYELRALAALGRIEELDAALRSSTDASALRQTALELAAHGHTDASRAMLDRARTWYETRPAPERATLDYQLGYARTLYLLRDSRSRVLYDSVLVTYPKCLDCVGAVGAAAARAGDTALAEQSAARLAGSTRRFLFGRHLLWGARIAAARGDWSLAATRLHAAFAAGSEFDIMTHADPDLAVINPDSIYRVFARVPTNR